MKFSQIIGHRGVIAELKHMVISNHIPHAILVVGAEGTGQLPISLALGGAILCTNLEDGDRCGSCLSCIKVNKWIHPDLHFSFPFTGSENNSDKFITKWRELLQESGGYFSYTDWMQRIDSENKQGNINREECFNIIRKLSLKAHEGDRKIMIIWLPEFLGKETNRLLKLIEEPPEGTIFVLATENPDGLLPTLISRCRVIRLGAISKEEIRGGLRNMFPDDGVEKMDSVVLRSMGKWGEAIKLMRSEPDEVEAMFMEWMRKCYKSNGGEIVPWVEGISKLGREEQKRFLLYGLHFLRGLLMEKLGLEDLRGIGKEEEENIKKILNAITLTTNQIESICNMFTDAIFAIERNANDKILFLDLSIRFGDAMKK
jgi:DNA polymerase III subunit delta'